MKKLFIYSFFTCLLLTFMFSCSKQESVQTTVSDEKQEMAALMVALDNYNTAYFQNKALFKRGGRTRSFWDWWRERRKKVLNADAKGALIGLLTGGGWGAICGAVTNSALACINTRDITPIEMGNQIFSPNGVGISHDDDLIDMQLQHPEMNYALENTVFESDITDCIDSAGYYHNKILWQLNQDSLISFTNSGMATIIDSICVKAEELENNDRNGMLVSELLQIIRYNQLDSAYRIPSIVMSDDSLQAIYITLFPEYQSEFEFIDNYISGLNEIDPKDNDGSYADGVLSIIRHSNVSDAVKRRLGTAVITGNASSLLWNFE
ncbi:MAG: hypothetical protein IJS95_02425 [Prevotella sp.]|nr:hypothetical protein [Prevotella sp.]